jgi:hypothetical protein
MIVRGNYVWKNGIPNSEVIFVKDENGKLLIQTNENKK